MKFTHLIGSLVCGMALAVTSFAEPPKKSPADSGSKDVTAAQVNGTWSYQKNTFQIWALGGGKLRISFDGIYEYKTSAGPSANLGDASGIATIEGDTAVFHPEDGEATDKITLKFTGGKLVVDQEGMCGFGHHVSAAGTYRKTSPKKPKFGE